jgi:hypothetical protein
VGLYAGLTDQGLPVSFRLAAARDHIEEFAIDTDLTGSDGSTVRHQIRWSPGFRMAGCEFAGTTPGGQFSGAFVPPSTFAGIWGDSYARDLTGMVFTAGGTFTATFQRDGDGGGADGGAADGGGADGGTPDGGIEDGGAADGGIADGGAADGGAPDIALPAGFTVEIYASGLSGPLALALDSSGGDLFVAEHLAGAVTRLPRTGGRTTALSGIAWPRGLSLVPPATLYVSHAGGIQALQLGGTPAAFGPALSFSAGPLACDEAPRCFVAELDFGARGQAVWLVTPASAEPVATAQSGVDQPFGLALEPGGLLIAEADLGFATADGVLFHALSFDGGVSGLTPLPLIAQPGALAVLRPDLFFTSEVVFSGTGARKVFLLDRGSRSTRAFAQGFSLPAGLQYDPTRKELFVSDLARGAVYRVRGPFDTL